MVRDSKKGTGDTQTPLNATIEHKDEKKESRVGKIIRTIFLVIVVVGIVALFVAIF